MNHTDGGVDTLAVPRHDVSLSGGAWHDAAASARSESGAHPTLPAADLRHDPDGGLVFDTSDALSRKLSTLPRERMAATTVDAWDVVIQAIRAGEAGQAGQDIIVEPGGALRLASSGGTEPRPLSTLPSERMACGHVGARSGD